MTTRRMLKEKQKTKKQLKIEKEKIANKYLNRIKDIIDLGYIEIMEDIDEFNEELMNSALTYSNIENMIRKIFKEELDINIIEEINDMILKSEEKHEEIYSIVTDPNLSNIKLLRRMPITAEKVTDVIKNAYDDLKDNKNQEYIISMIRNRSFAIFQKHNSVIIDIAIESNSYIDTYINARENFIDFIAQCKESIEQIQQMQNEIEHIEQTVKYKQRLRVSYSDLEKFLKYKGYECNRQGNTTHAVWKNIKTGKSMPLPNKSGTIPQGTTSKILKQMGSNRQELAEFLYA